MWYVAQVQAGRESSTLEMCRRLVPPSVMEDCFMPEYEVMWKIRGEWRLVKRLLFPGYLFFVTDDPEALNRELSRVPMPIRLLGNEENSFFPLTGKERDWFLSFMDGNHTVRMSEGYISGDKITVTRGPLMGFEGDIRKIDRHKRRAYIDVAYCAVFATPFHAPLLQRSMADCHVAMRVALIARGAQAPLLANTAGYALSRCACALTRRLQYG